MRNRQLSLIRRFAEDDQGQGVTEYALVLAIFAIPVLLGFYALSTRSGATYVRTTDDLTYRQMNR